MTLVSPPSDLTQERMVDLAEILLDRGTQSRLGGNDPATVQRYAAEMASGVWEFERRPLPLLFFDGDCYYPGDGHHRIAAARQCDRRELLCEVRPGSQREAQFFSNTEANKFHGKQLTRQDKRHRVSNLLLDPEWALMSDREIARYCGVSAPFVGKLRRTLVVTQQIAPNSHRRGRDGKVRNTTQMGKPSSPETPVQASTQISNQISDQISGQISAVHPEREQLLRERDALRQRLEAQAREHRLAIAQVTAASQNSELRQALADDEALMQRLYDGLGTILAALDPDRPPAELRRDVLKAAQGIELMRRILAAQAVNLQTDASEEE